MMWTRIGGIGKHRIGKITESKPYTSCCYRRGSRVTLYIYSDENGDIIIAKVRWKGFIRAAYARGRAVYSADELNAFAATRSCMRSARNGRLVEAESRFAELYAMASRGALYVWPLCVGKKSYDNRSRIMEA